MFLHKLCFFSLFLIGIPFFAQSDYTSGEKLFENEKYSEAKVHFTAYLESNPDHAKAQEYMGDIAAYTSDWDTAAAYYKKLVGRHPNNATYNFKYGGVLGKKAQSISKIRAASYVGDIKKYLHKAAELDPEHIEVRWALIDLYIALPVILGGSETKALQYAEELLALSEVDGYLAKGYVAEYYDRDKDAETYYKKAITSGQSPHTYEKLAAFYETKTAEPEKAIAVQEASLKKHRRNNLNYQIGKISAQYNIQLEKGKFYLQEYIKNYTVRDGVSLEWAYLRLAQIYRHLGKATQAQKWIDKALQVKNNFPEATAEKAKIQAL